MKLFVWDFHGVLEKGNDDAVLEITNMALEQHGYQRRMTSHEAEFLAGRRWYEYFSYLLPQLTEDECRTLQATCVVISNECPEILANYIRLNDHAEHVLENIHCKNFTQILISNTQPKILDMFVEIVGVSKYFPPSHRFGVDSHTQKKFTKLDCLANFLRDKHFPDGVISIGDSPGDMALIHDLPKGIGYHYTHPGRVHREVKSHYKIFDLRHVLQEVT